MKKLLLPALTGAIVCGSLLLWSCTKDENDPEPTPVYVKQAEGFAAGASTRLVLYTEETQIFSGYTRIYIALYDSVSGEKVDDAQVQLSPMMDMGAMKHSAPFENPESEKAVNHLFPCSVTFIMSSLGGSWELKITVMNRKNGRQGMITFPITVQEPAKSRQKSFTASHNGNKYFISLIEPSVGHAKVGINDLEIAVYRKASMMSFPADSSLNVSFTPEMPTMGHGSPNNINPIHIGNGHYKGKVNFTMTGLWWLHFYFMSGINVADTTQFFEVEF